MDAPCQGNTKAYCITRGSSRCAASAKRTNRQQGFVAGTAAGLETGHADLAGMAASRRWLFCGLGGGWSGANSPMKQHKMRVQRRNSSVQSIRWNDPVNVLVHRATAWDCVHCEQRQGCAPNHFERCRKHRREIGAATFVEYRAKFPHTTRAPAPAFSVEAQAQLHTLSPTPDFEPHTTRKLHRPPGRLGWKVSGGTPRPVF